MGQDPSTNKIHGKVFIARKVKRRSVDLTPTPPASFSLFDKKKSKEKEMAATFLQYWYGYREHVRECREY